MEFQEYRLKEICEIKSGKRIPKGMNFTTNPTNYPYIRARDIKDGKIQTSDLIYIDEVVYRKIKRYIVNCGDIVVTIAGTVGEIGYAQMDVDGYNLTENAVRLTSYKGFVNGKYLFYLLSQSHYKEYMQIISGGAAQPKLGIYKLERIKVLLPSINIQNQVVRFLSFLDEAVENNNKRIKILEQMAENLYKEWFVRFRFPGYEKVEFVDGIPRGWKKTTVEELSHILRRGISPTYADNGALTVISQKCIRTTIMDISEARKQNKLYSEELNLLNGDTVICSTGTGTLGRVGRVIGNYARTTFDSHVTLVRAKSGVSKLYLYGVLKGLQPWFVNMGIGSTNQQELYRATIKNAKALLPRYSIMEQYDKIACPIDKEICSLMRMNDNLKKQRDYLLPRLMSGKLQVK